MRGVSSGFHHDACQYLRDWSAAPDQNVSEMMKVIDRADKIGAGATIFDGTPMEMLQNDNAKSLYLRVP